MYDIAATGTAVATSRTGWDSYREKINLRVINKVVGTTPTTIYLGRHRNMQITAYDMDLLLCDQTFSVVNADEQRFVDAGSSVDLRDHTDEYITLATETSSTRVRIIVW